MALTVTGTSSFILGFILGFLLAHRRKSVKFSLTYETDEGKEDQGRAG